MLDVILQQALCLQIMILQHSGHSSNFVINQVEIKEQGHQLVSLRSEVSRNYEKLLLKNERKRELDYRDSQGGGQVCLAVISSFIVLLTWSQTTK